MQIKFGSWGSGTRHVSEIEQTSTYLLLDEIHCRSDPTVVAGDLQFTKQSMYKCAHLTATVLTRSYLFGASANAIVLVKQVYLLFTRVQDGKLTWDSIGAMLTALIQTVNVDITTGILCALVSIALIAVRSGLKLMKYQAGVGCKAIRQADGTNTYVEDISMCDGKRFLGDSYQRKLLSCMFLGKNLQLVIVSTLLVANSNQLHSQRIALLNLLGKRPQIDLRKVESGFQKMDYP